MQNGQGGTWVEFYKTAALKCFTDVMLDEWTQMCLDGKWVWLNDCTMEDGYCRRLYSFCLVVDAC
jgi:hypothetical protein